MNLRERFCNNKRFLNRRVVRYLLTICVVLLSLNTLLNALHFISISDRRDLRRQAELSRKMLDARARIQITLINTGLRRDAFTKSEKQKIGELWSSAEYDLVQPNPFTEDKPNVE